MNIFLDKYQSKQSNSYNSGCHVNLENSHKLISQGSYDEWVSQDDIYNDERQSCNRIRLTCQINVVASNVLHNCVTEIVQNEGSTTTGKTPVVCLNYGTSKGNVPSTIEGIINKNGSGSFWSTYDGRSYPLEAIRDTQLTNSRCNFVYHPGKDIFNNHILRSTTFKPVCNSTSSSDIFNTIKDTLRQEETSATVREYIPYPINANLPDNTKEVEELHLYKYDDILSFRDVLEKKLKHGYDGWYGFSNIAKLTTFSNFNSSKKNDENLLINKPINSANAGDFIDMYPSRDLYSFCPKYNKFRRRLEKNWNYCLTYPSSSTTEISFIDMSTNTDTTHAVNSLRAYAIDENTTTDNGTKQLVIYSISKHGLSEGDTVNVYYSNNGEAYQILDSVEVFTVVDDYIFAVFADGYQISEKWVDVTDPDLVNGDTLTVDGRVFDIKGDYLQSNGVRYPIINNYANIDDTRQHISYKKVEDGMECEYYVRIFSKLPNFKYASHVVNEYELYKEGSTLIKDCQSTYNEFENHISKLAFAKNIYGDDIGQLVFTDDIRFDSLRDNRGRPLSSIYLTIIKNNSGYRKWYGKNTDIDIGDESVEYSHCFGKVNCGFVESPESIDLYDLDDVNIRVMTNADSDINRNKEGLSTVKLNPDNRNELDTDEIDYKHDVNFYGDLVYYSPMKVIEATIQPIMFRFNTAQRELNSSEYPTSYSSFNNAFIDSITSDDYDYLPFNVKTEKMTSYFKTSYDLCSRPEGYFYLPHYEIPIRTYSELQTLYPNFLDIRTFNYNANDGTFTIYTLQQHFLGLGDKVMLYDTQNNELYYGLMTDIISPRKFVCKFVHEDESPVDFGHDNFPLSIYSQDDDISYKMFKIGSLDIPDYAGILHDGSCRYLWRNILYNGGDSNTNVETYPFTNNALYVNKAINLHLHRQDPYGESGLWTTAYPQDPVKLIISSENNYIEEEDIKC